MRTGVLRLHCADAKGIVYHVSKFIYENSGNIIDAQQHKEELDNRFFMRVHFDCEDMRCDKEALRALFLPISTQFGMTAEFAFSEEQPRLAIMVSKYDHCLYDLFLRRQYGEIDASIALVIGNHPDLRPVVESFGTPFYHVAVAKERREESEAEALALLSSHHVDAIVLARYMQILSPRMVEAYQHRIINVHHGFLPAFKGAKPYHQAYAYGVKLIGATSHYVTEDLDMGPIIYQESIPVNHTHSVPHLIALGRDIEKRVLASAVKAHVENRIMVYRRRTIVFE